MVRRTLWVVMALAVALNGFCWAEGSEDLATESAEEQKAESGEDKAGKSVWSDLDVQLYGFIKADASYDTSRTHTGNYVVWVEPELVKENDDEFNMTANETRLGIRVKGPDEGRMLTSGCIEVDFYGSSADENKAKLQMRHAYLQMQWPDRGLSLLAGQTWDVISPLIPHTLNYTVLNYVGNIGHRRPQIRLTKDFSLSSQTTLKLQTAISRTIGEDIIHSETGEDAGFPSLQGRVSLAFPWSPSGKSAVGLSGHWGREEYDDAVVVGETYTADSWSVIVDWHQPIYKWMALKVELFMGENLDAYVGGIGQGINPVTGEEIDSHGGWFSLAFDPSDKWQYNIGASFDDVEDEEVNEGDRTLNTSAFGNTIYAANKYMDIGLEISYWGTDYLGDGDADDLRFQASFKFKF
jgi:hypothetical protein